MGTIVLFVVLGIVAGTLSGLIGIGGGVIIVPALLFLFGFSQHQAQGTTLALLVPPIGILAAWTYYKHGYIDFHAALFIGIGFLVGSFLGAKVATSVPGIVIERIFGIALLLISLKMIFVK
ncbi:MAG TPA: sulfite exporter TauE/SafE family protein [Spirochaetota bacterium]|nr:sulfite exporter TauE/SafE family protein [Spirochaetota bacterium]HOD13839.1 sulfite exporter TauE/SafE family protein [Spirochaetota bacterium]HPG52456.1 sulfite exporter TauE/SafE family protein [Spirochaetota bacterium]HPN13906.1 sulfite exporter TauE/SafE family protein [Spirochaetota bacterium]